MAEFMTLKILFVFFFCSVTRFLRKITKTHVTRFGMITSTALYFQLTKKTNALKNTFSVEVGLFHEELNLLNVCAQNANLI